MLVQSCPPPPRASVGLVFSSPYCGLTSSPSSSDLSSTSLQDISSLPLQQDLANGNLEEEREGVMDNREVLRDLATHQSFLSTDSTVIKVESDILETESQVLNIETTVTETFTMSTDLLGDFGRDLLAEVDRRRNGGESELVDTRHSVPVVDIN